MGPLRPAWALRLGQSEDGSRKKGKGKRGASDEKKNWDRKSFGKILAHNKEIFSFCSTSYELILFCTVIFFVIKDR